MRRITLLALAIAVTPAPALAQAAQAPPAGATGSLDLGGRGTSVSGDAARYERYRDLGDGLFIENARFTRDRNGWLVDFRAEHVGRRDQRYEGLFGRPGRFKGWLLWDQIPMLMSNSTRTLFGAGGAADVLAIDDAIQTQAQATSGAALPGLFAQNSRIFDTRSRRHIFEGGFEYLATSTLTLKGTVRRTDREGVIPYGGSFGHSSVVELPAPVNHTLNDVEGSAEFSRDPVLVRAGYTGSWFTNEVTTLTFDSPFRLTDIASTPGRGRSSLPPSNSTMSVYGMGSVKLPARSRATAYLSLGSLKDAGAALMPQTINSANNPAAVERAAVEGEARTSAANLSFISRPVSRLNVSVRYKAYEYDNQTPEFHLTQRVSYDNAPGNAAMNSLGGTPSSQVHTEPFGVVRATFEADAGVGLGGGVTAGIGYLHRGEDRTHRFFETTTEHGVKATVDAVGHARYSLRSMYEHSQRRGTVTEAAERELFRIGEQPGMRHFDIASRDRDRVTVIGTVTPAPMMSLTASVAAGKDDYIESLFGLRDNGHRVYGLGVDLVPTDVATFSLSYSYERYAALSRSRQANPPSGAGAITFETFKDISSRPGTTVQVADASRNWATDALDRVHSVILAADVVRIGGKVDLGFTYDFSRARATYTYSTGPVEDRTLPEEVIVDPSLTVPPDAQLPTTLSELHRGTADVRYALTDRVGIGVSWWHERYRVNDFTLDAESTPNLARSSALLMGYLYRPYTANTIWARLFYRW
jgi:MtrB/PioB family decaheme-associated outer membrane protein